MFKALIRVCISVTSVRDQRDQGCLPPGVSCITLSINILCEILC